MLCIFLAMLASTLFAGAALQSAARPALRPLARAEFCAPRAGVAVCSFAPSPGPDSMRAPSPGPGSPSPSSSSLEADTLFFLVSAAALWGTYPTCVKLLFAAGPQLDPSIVVLVRFLIMATIGVSALVLSTSKFTLLRRYASARSAAATPWAVQLERRVPASVYLAALELGALGGLGTFFQTISLSQIPALTAAVLYSTVNVITPALAAVAGVDAAERDVDGRTWAACGLGLLASLWALIPDAAGLLPEALPAASSVGTGELVMLAAACCYAAVKVRLSSTLRYHAADEIAVGRLVGQAGCAAAGLGLIDETSAVHELLPEQVGGLGEPVDAVASELATWAAALTPEQLGLLLASSLLSGAGATWFQSNGQRKASAPKAQLWFATTPIFGALWAFLVLGEQFSWHQVTGAAGLIAAIALSFPNESEAEGVRAD